MADKTIIQQIIDGLKSPKVDSEKLAYCKTMEHCTMDDVAAPAAAKPSSGTNEKTPAR